MLKIYTYKSCDTCRKAVKFLRANDMAFEELAIRETPPKTSELLEMLKAYDGEIRRLFNTSGADYRALALGAKLPQMKEVDAVALLQGNGNLVKRPFLVGDGVYLVGFQDAAWREALG